MAKLTTTSTSDKLTDAERSYISGIQKELEFYDKFKEFMDQVQKITINQDRSKAGIFIHDNTNYLIDIALKCNFRKKL